MSTQARLIIVSLFLLLVWKDDISRLQPGVVSNQSVNIPVDATGKLWVADINADQIPSADRKYYGDFYMSMNWVLGNDSNHATRIIDTTEKFRRYHSGALDCAVELRKVGAYPGLGESIDKAFALAIWGGDPSTLKTAADVSKAIDEGLAPRPMTNAVSDRIRACAYAIAWKLHGGR